MTNIPVPRYTYSDYVQWKEDWELIGGYPYQLLPSGKWQHSRVQVKLAKQAEIQVESNNHCNCSVFIELDWKITNETVVRPDFMIACGDLQDDFLNFPPVLIVEIISQSSLQKDRNIKFDLYRENGVKYYLMLDYTKQTVEIFQLIDNVYRSVDTNHFILTDTCSIAFDFTNIFKT